MSAFLLMLGACKDAEESAPTESVTSDSYTIPSIGYTFRKAYPHDINSFTQGLLVHNGRLFESTGSPSDMPQTRSVFGIVDLNTGKIQVKGEIDRHFFGEGITILGGRLYQLTYQAKIGFIYDTLGYKKIGEFMMPGQEGWGMTTDGQSLIISDGTHRLFYLDPATMKTTKVLEVRDNMGQVNYLNELEFMDGHVYANKYGTNLKVKIDTADGRVRGRIDFTRLAQQARQEYAGSLEMNGIAQDPETGRVFITGKMWPFIFEVTIP